MDDLIFLSVAFGDRRYLDQLVRLKHSIRAIYPKANMIFYRDSLPPKSKPFHESLYGFKTAAIQEAIDKGYKRVIWLDPAMILTGPIDRLFKYPMVAVRDESKLYQCISDKFCDYILWDKEFIKRNNYHLVGGSLYYFDFHTAAARSIFDMWKHYEAGGWFGSQKEQASEQINSHRNDESCMAVAMYASGYTEPVTPDEVGYCVENNSMFQKKHFR